MSNIMTNEYYIQQVIQQLSNNGFSNKKDISYHNEFFLYVSKQNKSSNWPPSVLEQVYVLISQYSSLEDIVTFQRFAAASQKYVMRNKIFPYLPIIGMTYCFPVAVSCEVSDEVRKSLLESNPVVKTGYIGIPTIVDVANSSILFSNHPHWRAMFLLDHARDMINKLLLVWENTSTNTP